MIAGRLVLRKWSGRIPTTDLPLEDATSEVTLSCWDPIEVTRGFASGRLVALATKSISRATIPRTTGF